MLRLDNLVLLLHLKVVEALVHLLVDPHQLALDVLPLRVQVLLVLQDHVEILKLLIDLLLLLEVLPHSVFKNSLLLGLLVHGLVVELCAMLLKAAERLLVSQFALQGLLSDRNLPEGLLPLLSLGLVLELYPQALDLQCAVGVGWTRRVRRSWISARSSSRQRLPLQKKALLGWNGARWTRRSLHELHVHLSDLLLGLPMEGGDVRDFDKDSRQIVHTLLRWPASLSS